MPASVLLTLEPIWRTTKKLGGRVIALGKIILFKIIEFIQAHSHTAIGMAIGAAIGALSSLIPFIGPLLAPVATALGIAVFGTMGACMDCNTPSSGQALIHTAMDFFKLFAEIINTLFNELAEE